MTYHRNLIALTVAVLVLAACTTVEPVDTDEVVDQQGEAADDADAEGQEYEADEGEDPRDDDAAEDGEEVEELDPLQGLDLEVVVDGLREPVGAATLPDGRLLVVERTGTVQVVEDGAVAEEPFLDLTGTVNANSIEQGLLGLAVHPDLPDDPRVFVFHSRSDNNNVLVAYQLAGGGDRLDPDSREELLTVDKEPDKVRHNGGQLLFGPDGYLYLSVGDAARASVNGQDPSTLPGSILRIDVDGGHPYDIPPDNPFAEGGGAPEVWWYGLRNPWRFTIDEPTGLSYIADVGQETIEEVNVVPYDQGGHNFGWPAFEGSEPFYSDEPDSEVTDPVLEVRHDDTDRACSITGGLVYRGEALPELAGHYFYADWCRGWIRSFRYEDDEVVDHQDWSEQLDAEMVSSFALDGDAELLVLDTAAGSVSRVVPLR